VVKDKKTTKPEHLLKHTKLMQNYRMTERGMKSTMAS